MKKYRVTVNARKRGSIGEFSDITRLVDSELAAGAFEVFQRDKNLEVNHIVSITEIPMNDGSDTPVTPCCGNCGSSNVYASDVSVVWELSCWWIADGGDPDNIDCHECDHNGPPIWM